MKIKAALIDLWPPGGGKGSYKYKVGILVLWVCYCKVNYPGFRL